MTKFGPNRFGCGHWSEVEFIQKCLVEIHGGVVNRVSISDHNTPSIHALHVANCSNNAQNYPTYIFRYVKNTKGSKRTIEKVFSCGDLGTFANDKSCVLLLKDHHYYNMWDYGSLFDEVDCLTLGRKRPKGSGERYKKCFCLCCMVSFSNESLHVCQGRCPRCLGDMASHILGSSGEALLCESCCRQFNNEHCFKTHKAHVLMGDFGSFCNFLSTLKHCDTCRDDFELSIKCKHFGKKKKTLSISMGRYYFLNDTPMSKCGYVKCGYCSEYYLKGCQGHSCFLAPIDSIFGNEA